MGQEHPDDRFVLTGEERSQFRQIWKELADGEPQPLDPGTDDSRAAWSLAVLACLVLVFIALAANSVFLLLAATGGALGSHFAQRA